MDLGNWGLFSSWTPNSRTTQGFELHATYTSDHIIFIIIIVMLRCYMIGHSDRPPSQYQQRCRLYEGPATTHILEARLHLTALTHNVRGLELIHIHFPQSPHPPLLSLCLSNFSLTNCFIVIHKAIRLGCTRQPSSGFTFRQNKTGNHTSVAIYTYDSTELRPISPPYVKCL